MANVLRLCWLHPLVFSDCWAVMHEACWFLLHAGSQLVWLRDWRNHVWHHDSPMFSMLLLNVTFTNVETKSF